MKKMICVIFLGLSVLMSFDVNVAATVVSPITEQPASKAPSQLTYKPSLTRTEVESFLGRKMTFMERVGFKVNKKKFVKTTNQVNAMADSDRTNGMAIAGFVLSLIFAPLGIVFSAIALGQIKRTGERGYGFAIAGLVIGIAVTAIALISLL
ncbi:MAG: DUF4190 domain-containing protein [Chitinophagaceae bacterium]